MAGHVPDALLHALVSVATQTDLEVERMEGKIAVATQTDLEEERMENKIAFVGTKSDLMGLRKGHQVESESSAGSSIPRPVDAIARDRSTAQDYKRPIASENVAVLIPVSRVKEEKPNPLVTPCLHGDDWSAPHGYGRMPDG